MIFQCNSFTAFAYGVIENLLKSDNEVEVRRKLQSLMKTLQDEDYRLRKYEKAAKANLVDSTVNETQLKNSLTKAYKDVVRKQSFLIHCLFICLFGVLCGASRFKKISLIWKCHHYWQRPKNFDL